ncbi:hypothetical protein [Variovorax sp. KBW07]|nr:hypothetical protein [Variovorax sp. KBW07]
MSVIRDRVLETAKVPRSSKHLSADGLSAITDAVSERLSRVRSNAR